MTLKSRVSLRIKKRGVRMGIVKVMRKGVPCNKCSALFIPLRVLGAVAPMRGLGCRVVVSAASGR